MDTRLVALLAAACAALVLTGTAAPIAEDVGPLLPEETKRRDTTLQTLELEKTLKQLAGENKKYFPNPNRSPVIQVDGLSGDEQQLSRLGQEAQGGEQSKESKSEESESKESGEQSKSEEQETGVVEEAEEAVQEDTDAAGNTHINREEMMAAEEDHDDSAESNSVEESEEGRAGREGEEDMNEQLLEEMRKRGEEQRVLPTDEGQFINELFDLLDRHPQLAQLLIQAERQDEAEAAGYNDLEQRDPYEQQVYEPRGPGDQYQRRASPYSYLARLEERKRYWPSSDWADSQEFYQDFEGDPDAHVVSKKMMERYPQ